MNFKTIFSVATLALITIVNASPINNIPIEAIEKRCISYGKSKFLVDKKNGEYTCLRLDEGNELIYKTCFFDNRDVFCVEENLNTIPSCSKNRSDNDYTTCAYRIMEMIDDGSDKLTTRIRKFPTHEKIFYSYTIDQKECRGLDGIVLTYKTSQQYICLEPATPKTIKPNETHCVLVNGKIHCINQEDTNIDACIKNSFDYDIENCKRILKEFGLVNNYDIREFIN